MEEERNKPFLGALEEEGSHACNGYSHHGFICCPSCSAFTSLTCSLTIPQKEVCHLHLVQFLLVLLHLSAR